MLFRNSFIILLLIGFVTGAAFAEKPARSRGHEQLPEWTTNTLQSLSYGVLIEVEGFHSKMDGENQSDILLATVAFDLEASMNEWLSGHLGLLWEQYSREDNNIDEAYIALGASDDVPFYLIAGRFYQPVGNFESAFVSDPLTLELIEMNTESAMVGVGNGWGDLNVGVFKGDVKKGFETDGGGETNSIPDSTISDFYASLTLTPVKQLKMGAYWLSDLMESYNQIGVGNEISQVAGYEKVDAAGAFINAYLGVLTLNAEYVSALNDYNLTGGSYRPAAFSIEGSVQVQEKVTVGLKFDASNDLYAGYDRAIATFGDKLPGKAVAAVVAYDFHDNATIAAEYMHVAELDYDASGDIVTVQLGLSF